MRTHLLKGEANEVVTSTATKLGVDLLVMGSITRTGIAGFFIGSTAEEVAANVGCSLLALKPEGFVGQVAPSGEATEFRRRRTRV